MQDRTEIRVEFGNVSIGDQTARLGVKIARDAIPLSEADRMFCGRRVWGVVTLGQPDPNQKVLFDGAGIIIEGAWETKQLGVNPKAYSFGLNFNINEINIGDLAKFAKKVGVLTVVSVMDLDHEATADDEGWDHEEDREEGDSIEADEAKREAYKAGCEAAIAGKKRRCPNKMEESLKPLFLRGFDATEVSGADMRNCSGCHIDYDGNEHDACPQCSSTHFVRLEESKAD